MSHKIFFFYILHNTYLTSLVAFTPSHEVEGSYNPSYRGCWHEFSLYFSLSLIHYINIRLISFTHTKMCR